MHFNNDTGNNSKSVISLKGIGYTWSGFRHFLTREATFVTSCLLSVHNRLLKKGSSLIGKNLLPRGANSFLLEKTLFQKGGKTILRVVSL